MRFLAPAFLAIVESVMKVQGQAPDKKEPTVRQQYIELIFQVNHNI